MILMLLKSILSLYRLVTSGGTCVGFMHTKSVLINVDPGETVDSIVVEMIPLLPYL